MQAVVSEIAARLPRLERLHVPYDLPSTDNGRASCSCLLEGNPFGLGLPARRIEGAAFADQFIEAAERHYINRLAVNVIEMRLHGSEKR